MKKVYWIVIFPDLETPSGGIKQLHRFAECLVQLKQSVYLVQDDPNFTPHWFKSSIPCISQFEWDFGRNLSPDSNIIVLPETFVSTINKFPTNIPKIIFNQNTSYSFGIPFSKTLSKPSLILSYYTRPDILAVCCVSLYDYQVLTTAFCVPPNRVFLIRNCIDCETITSLPSPNSSKSICIMKRKNYRDALIVQELLKRQPCFSGWTFMLINNMSHEEVISTFQSSTLFLSFGFPEGFGLPVAEALAMQTLVIGYSGLGVKELFDIGGSLGVCWPVEYGDYVGFVEAFQQVNNHLADPTHLHSRLSSASKVVRSMYSMDEMRQSVSRMLVKLFS